MNLLNVRYQRDINSNYLIVETEADVNKQDYKILILINNDIKELLKLSVGNIDNKMELYYDISSKQKLSMILERQPVTYENLKKILECIIKTMEVIIEYLLDDNGIVLDPEYIYVIPGAYSLHFCYNPFYNGDNLKGLQQIFSKLIEKVDYEDKKAVELAYRAYQSSQKEEFQIGDLLALINDQTLSRCISEEIREGKVENSYTSLVKPQVFMQQINVEKEVLRCSLKGKIAISMFLIVAFGIGVSGCCYIVAAGPKSLILLVKIVAFLSMEIAISFLAIMKLLKICKNSKIIVEKEVLSYEEEQEEDYEYSIQPELVAEEQEPYGDTVLLAYSKKGDPRKLIPIYNHEMSEIVISHFPYVIGRIKGQADKVIDHPLVSRLHLCIEEENGGYYLVDLNSTNGVSINGVLLKSNEKKELLIGDEVGIASISYIFQ